ncbi:PWWP domain-containing MUM1-like protein [Labeo rohita]|uniref:PWWP domain-containing MUM1-like protein n=1 Tax=Labeo rohita TaxID=84645 RepID=A0A498LPH0_LABRO|nr:PWWP domain-containing MUM1-like protein [Labeo rohita]
MARSSSAQNTCNWIMALLALWSVVSLIVIVVWATWPPLAGVTQCRAAQQALIEKMEGAKVMTEKAQEVLKSTLKLSLENQTKLEEELECLLKSQKETNASLTESLRLQIVAKLMVIVPPYHIPQNEAGPGPGLTLALHRSQTFSPCLQKQIVAKLMVIVPPYHSPQNEAGPGPGLTLALHRSQTFSPCLQKQITAELMVIVPPYRSPQNEAGPGPGLTLALHRSQTFNPCLRQQLVAKLTTPPINGTPSRRVKPQRFAAAGRPRGRKKKNMVEQSIAPPPVKRCRKSATSPLKSTQEEPSVETLPINKACFETQLPEPQESDQNVSSDLSIELSLQEEPHPLNNSLFMEEEEDLDDDDEELPSFLQQDSKRCGSFSGSFIEYCAADISFPVRRKYSEGTSVMTFPIQEILSEQCDNPDSNIEDIVVEEQDELLSKKVLPDRSKAARNRANKQLVDFIIRRKVENRLLAVISGRESSKWMQALQRPSRPVVDIYLEDEEQVDKVYRYLDKVCDGAPQINTCLENIQADRIRLILDVLLPEAIIYAIAGVYKLSLEKAEEKYRRGPCFSNRERQEFDMMIEQQMKLKEITQRHRQ